MEISKNSFSNNRFDITGISEPVGRKMGIAGYHGGFWAIIGWIVARIFHKAVPIKTTEGIYYLNCNSLKNWLQRVAPGFAPAGNDKEFSKKMHDPDAVARMIELLIRPLNPPPTIIVDPEPVKDLSPDALWNHIENRTRKLKIDYQEFKEGEHRFPNVKCPKNTAIVVDNRSLHANQVADHFVASQAPLKESEPQFWQWIFENGYAIIDLTSPRDEVTKYYPQYLNETYEAGNFLIKLVEEEGMRKRYEVINTSTDETKMVTRYHSTKWGDFKAGSLELINELACAIDQNENNLVHCRAGIGRTGTLITSALLKKKIECGEITKENFNVELPLLLLSLREKRGEMFVQTPDQFKMVHLFGTTLLDEKVGV